MITQIGLAAGEIWDYLEHHDRKASMGELIGDLQKDRDLVLMSIGWLAREGHVFLEGTSSSSIVKLTD